MPFTHFCQKHISLLGKLFLAKQKCSLSTMANLEKYLALTKLPRVWLAYGPCVSLITVHQYYIYFFTDIPTKCVGNIRVYDVSNQIQILLCK